MKWLVTGAGGQLGTLATVFLNTMYEDVLALKSSELDVCDTKMVNEVFKSFKPNFVLNAAAWTKVDEAENQFESAFNVNCLGPRNLAIASNEIKCKLIHISTDYVFDGTENSPISENADVNPINNYGKTKALGEKQILELCPRNSIVVRTSWLYSKIGRNFAKTIIQKALIEKGQLNVVNDQYGQPTLIDELIPKIVELATREDAFGIYNISNAGTATWYEFACKIMEVTKLGSERINAISSDTFESNVKRPRYSVLSHVKLGQLAIPPMSDWQEAVKNSALDILAKVEAEIGI